MATTTKKKTKTAASAKKGKKKPAPKKKTAAKQGTDRKKMITLVAAVLALAVLLIAVFAVRGRYSETPRLKTDGNASWGIDVSSHNGKIDWKQVSGKADFAIIRIGCRGYTKGEISADKRAAYNLKNAGKHGVPTGVYFYSQATNEKEAEEEADFVIKALGGKKLSLPVFLDYEYPVVNGTHTGRMFDAKLSKKERTAMVNAFCDKIRSAGYTPGIYASSYIYRGELNMKSIPKDVFIWVADYNERVTYGGYYDIWQYSEKGQCDGIGSKYVDTNYFYTKNRL